MMARQVIDDLAVYCAVVSRRNLGDLGESGECDECCGQRIGLRRG